MYRHQTIYCFHLYLIIDPYIRFQNATFDIDAMRQYKFILIFSYSIFIVIKLKPEIFFEKKVSNKKNFYYLGISIFIFFFLLDYTILTFRIYRLDSFPKFPNPYLLI